MGRPVKPGDDEIERSATIAGAAYFTRVQVCDLPSIGIST